MPRQVLFPPADPELREAFQRAWEAWARTRTDRDTVKPAPSAVRSDRAHNRLPSVQ